LKRDQFLCVICRAAGRVESAVEVDHIRPRSAGGDDRLSNLRSVCAKHNPRDRPLAGGGDEVEVGTRVPTAAREDPDHGPLVA
jgi:5-methylcytosine-specific restriction endonuclease McrA